MSLWTCQRVAEGVKCGYRNPGIKRKCLMCGKPKPPRKRPKHMVALEAGYDMYVDLNDGDRCGICLRGRTETDRRFDRDHDHRTGRPRGLLCHRCNRQLASWVTAEWCWAAWHYMVRCRLLDEERLTWACEERGYETPCWIWQRATSDRGYAVIRHEGQTLYVHRLMVRGPIPEGYTVDHLCRQRDCINPAHLEAVTPAENVRRGSQAKLTADQIEEIRQQRAGGATTVELATAFGVSPSHVSRIVNRKRWDAA